MNSSTGEIRGPEFFKETRNDATPWIPISNEERAHLEPIEPRKRPAELKRIRKARVRSEKRRLGRNLTAEEMRAILG